MKKIILAILLSLAALPMVGQEYKYIKSDVKTTDGRIVETYPCAFDHQTEQYLLCLNYMRSGSQEVYYLSILSNDQVAPWYILPGDKAYVQLLDEDPIQLVSILDAKPETYQVNGVNKYRVLTSYIIPSNSYDKLFKGFNKFKIDVRMSSNDKQTSIFVRMPFDCVEHVVMSYLELMSATGR